MSELLPGLPADLGGSPAECAQRMRQGLAALAAAVGPFADHQSQRRAHTATLSHTRVVVVDAEFASGAEAQRSLGDALFAYRHHRNPDTDATIDGNVGTPLERPAWGLPLGMPTTMLSPHGPMHRWPSPLSFTVARLSTGRCVLVAVARDVDLVDAEVQRGGGTYPTQVAGNATTGAIATLLDQFLVDSRRHGHIEKAPWSAEVAWP